MFSDVRNGRSGDCFLHVALDNEIDVKFCILKVTRFCPCNECTIFNSGEVINERNPLVEESQGLIPVVHNL